ncbi:MAG: UDP-glucuronic acid decarboxylase family protein [Verrucomicrobiota bacterium]|nr:UDP-glucuronic acid decarboxylase family protein [Verrucomicrobiota bacterium]
MKNTYDKKILVTGGAGFLGSFLCERLIDENNYVICMDNFYTGQINNVKHLTNNPYFQIVTHDVIIPFYHEVDEIYNLACPASPIHYQHDPIKTNKTSVLGAINCLNLAKKLKAKIFQASTSEVYGDPNINPQNEDYWGNVNTVGIRSCYDEGKRCAETFFIDYKREYNLDIKIGRIFNTYGPRMHPNDGRVVSNFIIQALKNKDITIYGDGNQTRSFCYCDDLINSFIKFMDTRKEIFGPINLGNPGEFTMIELAELIIKLTNSNSNLTFKPLPKDDPKQRCPDISLAKKELDWEPQISLKDGLYKTINYFEKII